MKKKNLKLEDLKVNSFVTDFSKDLVKGGAGLTGNYDTLPFPNCATTLFTNNLTQNICN